MSDVFRPIAAGLWSLMAVFHIAASADLVKASPIEHWFYAAVILFFIIPSLLRNPQ